MRCCAWDLPQPDGNSLMRCVLTVFPRPTSSTPPALLRKSLADRFHSVQKAPPASHHPPRTTLTQNPQKNTSFKINIDININIIVIVIVISIPHPILKFYIIAQPPLLALLLLPPPTTPLPTPLNPGVSAPSSSSACNICASRALRLLRRLPAPAAPASSCAIMNSVHLRSSRRAAVKSPRSTRFVCSSTVG